VAVKYPLSGVVVYQQLSYPIGDPDEDWIVYINGTPTGSKGVVELKSSGLRSVELK
jgi:hypothetical protein